MTALSIPKTKFVVAGVGVYLMTWLTYPLVMELCRLCLLSFIWDRWRHLTVVALMTSLGDCLWRPVRLALSERCSLTVIFLFTLSGFCINACVLSILLYGSECWCPLRRDLQRLDGFHHHCIRVVLCVSRRKQWDEHLSNYQLRTQWGDAALVSDRIRKRRMEWLGHMARLDDGRVPKQLLFGCLPATRPACGPRRRWRDVVASDLDRLGISTAEWYGLARNRQGWRSDVLDASLDPPDLPQDSRVQCVTCSRSLRRAGDRAQHKCVAERRLPTHLQRGAVQCLMCSRWFASSGGMAVHRCEPPDQQPVVDPPSHRPPEDLECAVCARKFKSQTSSARHHCSRGTRVSAAERAAFEFVCGRCCCRFRRDSDLRRHLRFCS